ncbi:GPI mannosyltransferase 2-like [Quercus robur]|uniref:GPI mannosyltransferase 2-like n=1 Tax=Quercus robur TaxID=38942 RepID=UPI002163F191|nr:GPI mannosyltransferase 2-like [Quercus robur]
MRPWCKARVPLLYNFIQSHYWGVGFLRYFQLKLLPNFLLASPILSLAVCSIIYYAKSRPESAFCSLGFQASIEEKNSSALLFSLESVPRSNIARLPEKSYSKIQENHNLRQRKHTNIVDPIALPIENDPLAKLGYLSLFSHLFCSWDLWQLQHFLSCMCRWLHVSCQPALPFIGLPHI